MATSKRFVLASRSPRRIALLRQIGLNPEVVPSSVEEDFDSTASPSENATRLALAKARDVGNGFASALVLGADTIVVLDGAYLGKPETAEDAVRMLRLLSGKTHSVFTGVALVDRPSNRSIVDFEETRVTFRPIPLDEIRRYVAGGSPLDKAGAYGIQDDYGAVFVSRIEGCYYNVVGLPLARLYQRLKEFESQPGT